MLPGRGRHVRRGDPRGRPTHARRIHRPGFPRGAQQLPRGSAASFSGLAVSCPVRPVLAPSEQISNRLITRRTPMPEAVIVSTARSPIGRAGKGSLKDMRPDDLAAQMVRAALAKVPGSTPRDHRPDPRHRPARRRVGQQPRAHRRRPEPGWTTCQVSRSTATARAACRPPAWPSTRSRQGRATRSSPRASRR